MVNPGKQCHDVIGDFAGADDLLWAAQSGKLTQMGEVCVARSGRIGPLVEMLMARKSMPLAFTTVKFEAPFASTIARAISAGRIGGTAFRSRAGVFPLRCYADEGDGADRWALWRSRAEQAAIAVGFPRPLAAGIIGAMGELRENVFRHSRNADLGLAAYMPQLWTALRSSFRTQALVFWQASTNTPTTPIWLTPARRSRSRSKMATPGSAGRVGMDLGWGRCSGHLRIMMETYAFVARITRLSCAGTAPACKAASSSRTKLAWAG